MCTALIIKNKNPLFGRTLDLDYSYDEEVIITPQKFPINYKYLGFKKTKYKIIGIGINIDNYPLYYDAMNEHGLCMASLNFPKSASYNNYKINHLNLTEYELTLYILSSFKSVDEVITNINNLNITNDSFKENLKCSHLHFFITDYKKTIVIESTKNSINIYENPYNILTNEPVFPEQIKNIDYYNINNFPGDYSSNSRFVRLYTITKNIKDYQEIDIDLFFSIFNTVLEYKGLNTSNNIDHHTLYTSCYDINNLLLYYKIEYSNIYYVVSISDNIDKNIYSFKIKNR